MKKLEVWPKIKICIYFRLGINFKGHLVQIQKVKYLKTFTEIYK